MSYDQVNEGKPFVIETGQNMHLACCDCGSIHVVKFKKVRSGVLVTMLPKGKKTAAIRRTYGIKLKKSPTW